MTNLVPAADRPVGGAYRVDISRGRNIGRVSSEWFSRPDDERFLSLTDLYDVVRARADRATTRVVDSNSCARRVSSMLFLFASVMLDPRYGHARI